jgi:hypothetical protein
MFCTIGLTGPCRCNCQHPGSCGIALHARTRVSSSVEICSKCVTSLQLCHTSRNALWLQEVSASAGVTQAYRTGCSVAQHALSFLTPLALRVQSFGTAFMPPDESKRCKAKITHRVKYLVPRKYRPNAWLRQGNNADIRACSDVEGVRLYDTWLLRNFA